MPTISDQQIAQYAYNAGFRGDALNTAVAVALAESRGRTGAIGDITLQNGTWGPSVGLWQIRSLNAGHGTAAERTLRDATANTDPATNARHAYTISRHGNNFGPWSTYTGGDYRRYLNRARTASGHLSAAPATGAGATAFQVRPSTLDQSATEFDAQAQRLTSVRDATSAPGLASSAFGGLPESGQAAESHTAAIAKVAQELASEIERAATLSSGLRASSANYLDGDQTTALAYLALMD